MDSILLPMKKRCTELFMYLSGEVDKEQQSTKSRTRQERKPLVRVQNDPFQPFSAHFSALKFIQCSNL